MSEKNTGGPAFPCMPPQDTSAGVATGYPFPDSGMTLRDYFAEKAMQGLCADPNVVSNADMIAKASYQVADSMLKAREA